LGGWGPSNKLLGPHVAKVFLREGGGKGGSSHTPFFQLQLKGSKHSCGFQLKGWGYGARADPPLPSGESTRRSARSKPFSWFLFKRLWVPPWRRPLFFGFNRFPRMLFFPWKVFLPWLKLYLAHVAGVGHIPIDASPMDGSTSIAAHLTCAPSTFGRK
jgi:hypothetical protein